jgi:hypothetical protein
MSYQFYHSLHFLGLGLVLFALGGASFATYLEGQKPAKLKKPIGMLHGIGIFIMLVAGFGMLAKLGIMASLPNWVYLKILIWVILGGWIAIVYKLAVKHPVVAGLLPVVLVVLAGWLANAKLL